MKTGKILLVLGIAALVSILAVSQSVYALKTLDKAEVKDGAEATDAQAKAEEQLPPKGAVYDMGIDLIDAGLFSAGEYLTREKIIKLRQKTNNPVTGKPWSESTIDREIASFLKMDLLQNEPGGGFIVTKTINRPQWNGILKATRAIITTPEKVTGLALGLRRYTVDDLDGATIGSIKTAIDQVLQVSSANPFDHETKEKIIPTTDRAILNEDGVEVKRIEGFIEQGYTISIATANVDQTYLDKITSVFSKPDLIRRLIQEDVIIFSKVDADSDIFAAIEANVAKDAAARTVNNLTPKQQAALKSGV